MVRVVRSSGDSCFLGAAEAAPYPNAFVEVPSHRSVQTEILRPAKKSAGSQDDRA